MYVMSEGHVDWLRYWPYEGSRLISTHVATIIEHYSASQRSGVLTAYCGRARAGVFNCN